MTRFRVKRASQDAFDAAKVIFQAEGFTCSMGMGGKHVLCIARRDEIEIRIPLASTPAGGVGAAVRMAESTARKRLRRLPTKRDPSGAAGV